MRSTDAPIDVLVVEDDPDSRHLLQEVFQSRGHRVDACADAESGWTSFQRVRHPLVVLDWKLPGMDGLELCRLIRDVPDTHDVFILFVTGVEQRDALEEALQAGASDYLAKSAFAESLHVRLAIAERHVRRLQERRSVEAQLAKDALHDPVTGLPNRSLFHERLDQSARRADRQKTHLFSVLIVDLVDFKAINQRVGREVGDRILRETALRLEDCVRGVDTVARLASDDFAILLDGLTDVSDPTRVVHRVHQAFSFPFRIDDQEIFVSACIGIALSITGFGDPQDLVRDAQQALLKAKAVGPGTHLMHDPVMHARAMARVQLEVKIRRAVEEEELVLHYQPLVDLESGRVRSLEALVRWKDPERGLVQPVDFVPVAEETGLIVPLGRWVTRAALSQVRKWRQETGQDVAVCVNFSGRQFGTAGIVEQIGEDLEDFGLPGSAFQIELTETSLMRNSDSATRLLQRLKDRDVRIHVDDFGTGYSSLSYLCRFPIDALKIDRSFVSQMTHSTGNLEVVRTIVRLARNLDMSVIGEGVETEGQLALLRELECDTAQGFLFSRAITGGEVLQLLEGPSFGFLP